MRKAIEKKAVMRYESNTVLIVYFISNGLMDKEYAAIIDKFVKAELLERITNFQSLIVLGFGAGLPLRYEIHAA